jgi:glycosyltransferase involved in cell wall biosynthesis
MKVSCIVPAYNEASRIMNVLEVLVHHELVGEVIVVNDASTDDTKELLDKFPGITLINHESNMGKTKAILTGLHQSKYEMVMLIDSDLVGLSSVAIADLITPVLVGTADITISLRYNALSIYKLFGIDFVSGERVFAKRLLLEHEEVLRTLPGFGLEVFMNQLIIKNGLRLRVVVWPTVISPRKSVKIGFFAGVLGDMRMIAQIIHTVSLYTCLYQMYMMRKLSRNHI